MENRCSHTYNNLAKRILTIQSKSFLGKVGLKTIQ